MAWCGVGRYMREPSRASVCTNCTQICVRKSLSTCMPFGFFNTCATHPASTSRRQAIAILVTEQYFKTSNIEAAARVERWQSYESMVMEYTFLQLTCRFPRMLVWYVGGIQSGCVGMPNGIPLHATSSLWSVEHSKFAPFAPTCLQSPKKLFNRKTSNNTLKP